MIGRQSLNKLSTVSKPDRFSRSFLRKSPLEVLLLYTGDPQGEQYVTHASLPDSVALNS